MNKIIIYSFFILLLTSCGYQDAETIQGNPFRVSSSFSVSNADLEGIELEEGKTEADYMDEYLAFAVVEIKSGSQLIDTTVDYLKLEKLLISNNQNFKTLRLKLYKYFRDVNLGALDKDTLAALYINAYNFFCIETVIKNINGGTLKSIIDIGGKGSFTAFQKLENDFGGQKVTLDFLENGMLRPLLDFADARIHFALICASKGCPVLLVNAYRPLTLSSQLDDTTKIGMRLPRIYKIEGNTMYLSQIFDWFKSDFENQSETVEAFIRQYGTNVPTPLPTKLGYVTYDWDLNAAQ